MQTEILTLFKNRLSDLIDLILIVMVYTSLTCSRVKKIKEMTITWVVSAIPSLPITII